MSNVVGLVEELIPPKNVTLKQKAYLQAFANRLNYTMTQHLRDIVLHSVDSFKKLWDEYAMKDEQKEVEEDEFEVPDLASEKNEEKKFARPPFFLIKLVVNEVSQFVFIPYLEEIEETVLTMLDELCDSVEGIEDLTSRLDPRICGTKHPKFIDTIQKDHPHLLAARAAIHVIYLTKYA